MSESAKRLLTITRIALFATAFTPLVVAQRVFFPYIFGKMFFFRVALAVAVILIASWFLVMLRRGTLAENSSAIFRSFWNRLKSPPVFLLGLFLLVVLVGVFFAQNSYRAFWGDIERGEGFVGLLYVFLFLLACLMVFERSHWLWYFKLLLVSGAVVMLYAWFEFLGVTNIPFARAPTDRPGSFIGNAAFLATHCFFLIIAGAVVFRDSLKQRNGKFWAILAGATAVFAFLTIFITGTRGALLGAAVGILVFLGTVAAGWKGIIGSDEESATRRRRLWRLLSAVAIVTLIGGSAAFWITRHSSFWQSIPGVSRLARTAAFDIHDASTQTRLITWKISWRAFLERPVLGWGQDNYLIAYEKYYDPDYALYGETWLDRAHNKFFDVLVMQGAVGFVLYIGFLFALFWTVVRYLKPYRTVLIAALSAYVVQSIFLFDQVISYITLAGLVGFAAYERAAQKTEEQKSAGVVTLKPSAATAARAGAVVLIGLAAYSIWALNWVPFAQMRAFYASPGLGNVDLVTAKLREAMYPYNFVQLNIRGQGLDTVYLEQYFHNDEYRKNPKFSSLGTLLLESNAEIIRREPYDIRIFLRHIEMLDALASEKPELLKDGEQYLRQALEKAPGRQEIYYHLAVNLGKQNRYDEAIEIARRAVDLSPEVARARFYLGLVLAGSGRNTEGQAQIAYFEKLPNAYRNLLVSDLNSLLMLYHVWGRDDKVAEVVEKSVRGELSYVFSDEYYILTLGVLAYERDAQNFVSVAEFVKRAFPKWNDQMEVLIDLIQKGRWDMLDAMQ